MNFNFFVSLILSFLISRIVILSILHSHMEFTSNNLTFVIVTFNSRKVIYDCLKSLPKDFNKLIVENSSDVELKKELEQNYDKTEVILSKNVGMGAGNNLGIIKSNTKYVYILNPDVLLKHDTIKNINNSISKLKNFAILSPLSDNPHYPNYKLNFGKAQKNDDKIIYEVEEIDGYSMIINKDYFDNSVFFDEKFFMYLENVDLCLRAKKKGGKLFIITNSNVHHLGSQAVDEKYNEEIELSRNWHWMWSKLYFNKKHRGIFISSLFGLSSLVGNFLKYSMCLITFNKKRNIYRMRMSGTINSLLGRQS
ncbi:glycosyltransferase, partial [Candidatus Pelagibacter sp.]|nr:glycosyltransferase [Candidatus Pelagibacter sp.]